VIDGVDGVEEADADDVDGDEVDEDGVDDDEVDEDGVDDDEVDEDGPTGRARMCCQSKPTSE
jgi:hypothetical protein